MCGVCDVRQPAAVIPRRVRRGDVAGGLVGQTNAEVDLARRIPQPTRTTGVGEDRDELTGRPLLQVQEGRLAEERREVARNRSLRRRRLSNHAQSECRCSDRGKNPTHSA